MTHISLFLQTQNHFCERYQIFLSQSTQSLYMTNQFFRWHKNRKHEIRKIGDCHEFKISITTRNKAIYKAYNDFVLYDTIYS